MVPDRGATHVNVEVCVAATDAHQTVPAANSISSVTLTHKIYCKQCQLSRKYKSGGKREDHQNCSVLYCVLKLSTVISTLRWAVPTVLWIGFCHTGPLSLCIDLSVFICAYFVCFCFIVHSCCIIVNVVGWTWWDQSLILRTYLPSVLWHCWLGHLTFASNVTLLLSRLLAYKHHFKNGYHLQ